MNRDFRALDDIYARIPSLPCKRKCQECCGPIGFSEGEGERLGEVRVHADLMCAKITITGGCSSYAIRPTVCRLWGVTEGMECPFGCRPEKMLTDAEARQILLDVQAWSGGEPRYSELAQ